MAKRKPTPKQLEKLTSGGGGGQDLPSIKEVLASDHGFGTYRGKENSIATVGLELPVLRIGKNPLGFYISNVEEIHDSEKTTTVKKKRKRYPTEEVKASKKRCQSVGDDVGESQTSE
ncbi:hypothetical protein PG991_013460 [Apiospora marii]|uniref:Uncharacterized protein n=1 Tax=Apiospora marii TaxID=335849 RepID=A0ABR1R664_9PEZI